MSLYNYVDTVNANLICCICRAPFTDPMTTHTCAHTFCADCIMRALSHAASCPIDRMPLVLADLSPANPIVRSLVDELQVECVHKADGCKYVSQRQVMPLHLRDECDYAEVQCEENEGKVCGASMQRMVLKAHRMEVHGLKEDEEGKKESVSWNTEEADLEEEKETHTCPHASVGCPYKGPLETSEHLLSCPYESLKGFFTANSAKMSLLTEQNVVLRHKVDTLEQMVHILRKEMNAAKNALGPWFRSYYQGVNLPVHGGATGVGGGGMASSDLPIGMQPATAGPSVVGLEEDRDVLAQYFPAEDLMLRGQWTPSSTGDSIYGRAGGVVAPLDLGTTLEGTLVGLRESVVGLAAGVDSVGRRGEIALANETLRLGEEMMSVRAQMHGLRMQVHGMMMDRNAALSMREEAGPGTGGPYLRAHTNFGSITKL